MQDASYDAYAEEEVLVKGPSPVAVAVAAAVAAATGAKATEIDPEAAHVRQKLMVSTFGQLLRSKVLFCQRNVVSHRSSHRRGLFSGSFPASCRVTLMLRHESAVSRVVDLLIFSDSLLCWDRAHTVIHIKTCPPQYVRLECLRPEMIPVCHGTLQGFMWLGVRDNTMGHSCSRILGSAIIH